MKKIALLLLVSMAVFASGPAYAGVESLVTDIPGDLKAIALSWPALVVIGAGIATTNFVSLDNNIQSKFTDGPHLGAASKFASRLGEIYVWDSSAVAVYGMGLLLKNDDMTTTGEALVEALGMTEVSTFALQRAFHRKGPDGEKYSFPSGHTARAFAAASVLETMHGPLYGLPAFAVAGLIGFSRIDKNKHFFTDLLFGAAWGSAIGWGAATYHKDKYSSFHVVPMSASGPGVTISYMF